MSGWFLYLKANSYYFPSLMMSYLKVDIANKTIRIHLMEGLLE